MAAGAPQRPPKGSPCYPRLACSLGLGEPLGVQAQSFLRCSRDSAAHDFSSRMILSRRRLNSAHPMVLRMSHRAEIRSRIRGPLAIAVA